MAWLAALLARREGGGTGAGAGDAPFSLTTSDGAGLRLTSLTAKVVVSGPLAFAELALSFENPAPRVREGRFHVTLPEGAAVTRFAMKIGGRFVEAEMVERQRAREIFEAHLHVRQDPALLEHRAGNGFAARVFPIAPRETKHLRLSFAQTLTDPRRPFRLPLRGLPRLDRVELSVLVTPRDPRHRSRWMKWRHRDWIPTGDLEVPVSRAFAGLSHGALALVRIQPTLGSHVHRIPGLLVLVDTSASRALGLADQLERLGSLVAALRARHGAELPLQVAAFDQSVQPMFRGQAGRFNAAHLAAIGERGALGASNLQGALAWAARQRGFGQVLLITDGLPTAGATTTAALRQAVAALAPQVQRLDAIVFGGLRDEALLSQLVSTCLRQDGVVLDGTRPAEALANRLSLAAQSGIQVRVPGADWVFPPVLDGLQPGDAALVYARRAQGRPWGRALTVALSGPVEERHQVPLASAAGPLLTRAFVGARMAWLRGLGDNAYLRQEIRDLSIAHRVLSEYTALLVLEREADYARFGLRSRPPADLLEVGSHGVAWRRRTWRRVSLPPGPGRRPGPRRPRGFRVLGDILAGDARVPSLQRPEIFRPFSPGDDVPRRPTAPGVSIARRRPARPMVFMSRASVTGGLDAATIRRTVRRYLNQVRHCYERELGLRPQLAGRLQLTWLVEPDGHVNRVAVRADPGLALPSLEQCLRRRVRGWRFPAEGGRSVVSYPLNLSPVEQVVRNLEPRVATDQGAPSPSPGGARPPKNEVARRPRPRLPRAVPLPSLTGSPHHGPMAGVQALLGSGQAQAALLLARHWQQQAPGDVLAAIALGDALRATGHQEAALRAYGSVIDLYPHRADLRRAVGDRILAVALVPSENTSARRAALALAADTFEKALADRPDHVTGYRKLATVRLVQGDAAAAFRLLERGLARIYPEGRFRGYEEVLRRDLQLAGLAWHRQSPPRSAAIAERMRRHGQSLSPRPTMRFVLSWETDTTNLDLQVHDRLGAPSDWSRDQDHFGGALVNDVTNGYGPEAFEVPAALRGPAYPGGPYRLRVLAQGRGAVGHTLGAVHIVRHDGRGRFRIEVRPFVVMKDWVRIDLGVVPP